MVSDVSSGFRGDTVLRAVTGTITPGVTTLLGGESARDTTLLSVLVGQMCRSPGTITATCTAVGTLREPR